MPPSVVLCDAYYMPLKEISVEHAVYLLFSGKATPVQVMDGLVPVAKLGIAPSAEANWGARFQDLIVGGMFLVPNAIRLNRPVAFRLASLRPSRHLIFKRDRHTCQYCGRRTELTLDHVMPQSRGGPDTWENLVSACVTCNQKKADRTPDEAGMKLAKLPRRYVPNLMVEVMAKLTGCPA
jgi:HNH endonuclease